jgi:hypothetical protein
MIESVTQFTHMNTAAPHDSYLGTILHKTTNCVRGVYNFATTGGAVGAQNLVDDQGNAILLPVGAIIVRSYYDVITAFTSGGSATVALSVQAANDVLSALAVASLTTGVAAGVSTGSAATMKKVSTTAKPLVLTVATAALTAGKMNVFLEYVLSE